MTRKEITFAALNSHYLDTSCMCINEDYLNDAIIMWGSNTERHYNAICKSKRKIISVVWEIFADLVNDHIRSNEYPYNQNCVCSSAQLKAWLQQYGNGYDTLLESVAYFQDMRSEYSEV